LACKIRIYVLESEKEKKGNRMNAAINPLYTYARQQRASICPVGQGDQAIINSMKLGNRRNNRLPVAAPAARRNFQTVWTSPVYAVSA
jgi:hypothetical protein